MRDLLKLDAPPKLASGFTSDPPDGTFSNNERALFVTTGLRGDYQRAAQTLSEQVARNATALGRITGGTTDALTFIKTFGRRAFRRPLTAAEEQRYQALFTKGAEVFGTGNAFTDGVQLVIETMLQSAHFTYRTELGPASQPLSGYEVGAKLSLLLRSTIPDDALLSAAQAGELDTQEGVLARARQMIQDDAAQTAFRRFHGELFGLERYGSIDKDTSLFPKYSDALNVDLQTGDEMFLAHIFSQGRGFTELLTSTVGFVNSALAPFYGVTASGSGFTQVDLGAQRPGFFTRLGFLAYNANMRAPDPIHRGVDIVHRVLCIDIAAPPGEIPPLPDGKPGQSNRERVEAHTGANTCGAGCHAGIINPIGFAFESFDAIGQIRTMDNGKPVDTTGTYSFSSGAKTFSGAADMLKLLASDSLAHGCYTAQLAEFSLGRDVSESDRALISTLQNASMTPNSSIKDLALAIIADPAFRVRSGGQP